MDSLMAQLKTYDWGGDRGSLAGIDEYITAAQGNTNTLMEIEAALLGVLQSDVALPAKEYICRQLALIGTAQSVPVLARMLDSEEFSDCARLALEAIPGASANKVLLAALSDTIGNARIGIVNSLGERGGQEAVPVLSKLRNSTDKTLAAAVEKALQKIARRTGREQA